MMRAKLRFRILFSLLAFCGCTGGASAYDWDKWLSDVWLNSPSIRISRLGYNEAVRAVVEKARKGLTIGTFKNPVYDPGTASCAGGQVKVGAEQIKFAPPPKNWKDLKDDRIVCSWRFKMDAPDLLRLRFGRCPVAVFFNGERLTSGTQGLWAALSQGGQGLAAVAGDNELIAVFPDAGQFDADPVLYPEGAAKRPPADLITKVRSVPTKEGIETLATLLWEYSESVTADPLKLAPGYVAWAQSCDNIVRKTSDTKHPELIAESLQHAIFVLWMDNAARLVSAIEREFPSWAMDATFFPGKKFKADTALKVARGWLLRRELDKVQEYTNRWQETIEKLPPDQENWKKFAEYLRDISGDCADYNDYTLGIALAKKGVEVNTKQLKRDEKNDQVKRYNEIISKLSWLARTSTGDIASPEAEQHFSQISDLLAAGKLEQAALQRIYSVYVANGNLLLARGVTAISLRKALRIRLQQVPGAWEALCQFAAKRVDEDSSDVLARKDLAAIERSVNDLSGLVNTDKIRLSLMRSYVDRDQLAQARQQALLLTGATAKETKSLAYAYLLFLENRLGVASSDRARVPADLLTLRVPFQGAPTLLSKLAETFFPDMPAGIKARKAGMPGQVTGFLPLEAAVSPAAWGDKRNYSDNKNLLAQPVEPLSYGNEVAAADFSGVWMAGANGAVKWRFNYPAVVGGLNGPDNSGSTAITSDGESLLALAPSMQGAGANLFALTHDGRVKWQSSDARKNGKWSVCGLPYPAFGRLYSLVIDTGTPDNYVLGVSCLSASDGEVLNPAPLMTMPRSFRLQNFLTGRHFASGPSGVYGWTGNGGAFGIDRETGLVDWLTTIPLKNERFRGGPEGYCGLVGDKLLTYMPEATEMVMTDPATGAVLWRRLLPDLIAFHSRGASDQILVTSIGWGRSALISLDPQTGDPRWILDTSALMLTGEGTVVDGAVYLPVQGGIAVFAVADGRFQQAMPAEQKILKLRRDADRWYASTLQGVYLLAPDGKFSGFPEQAPVLPPAVAVPAIAAQQAPDQKLNLEWELPAYRIDKGDLHVSSIPGNPHLFAITNDEYMTLLAEGHYNAAGTYQPPRILWNSYLPNRIMNGNYVATYTDSQLQVYSLLDRKPVFSFSPGTGQDGLFRSFLIRNVQLGGDAVAFRLENGTILIGDLKTGKLNPTVFRFPGDNDMMSFNGRYMIVGRWDKPCVCYDTKEGGKKVWSRDEQCFSRTMVGDDRFLLQSKGKLELITIANGQGVGITGNLDRQMSGVTQVGDYIRVDWNKIIHMKEKRLVSNYGTVVSDLQNKVFMTLDGANENRRVNLMTPKGIYELTGVPEQVRRNRWGNGEVSVGVFGDRVYAFFIEQVNIYDINDGKLLATRRLCPDYNGRGVFLGRSLMTSNPNDNFLYFFGDTKPVNGDVQVTSAVEGGGDAPRRGWAPEFPLQARNWQGGEAPAGFSLRLGNGGGLYYLEVATPEDYAGDDYRLGVGLAGENGYHQQDFDFSLSAAATAADKGELCQPASGVTVASEVQNGRRLFYITITLPKSDNPSAVTLPDLALRIDRTRAGVPVGSFVFGSAVLHNYARFNTPPGDWVDCQSADNFAAREKLYSAAQSFFPQGTELLAWLRTRRVFRGCEDNVAFLEGMTRRAANAPCAANILSALLLEKMALFMKSHPDADQCSAEYQQKLAETAKELKAFADGAKVPEAYSMTGLSGFTVVLYDSSTDNSLMEWVNLVRTKPNRMESVFYLRRNSPFVGIRGAQTLVTLPLGAGQGMELISKVDSLYFARGRFGEVNYFSPAGLRSIISAGGKAGQDVVLVSSQNKESKDPQKAEGFWSGVYDVQKGIYYRSGDYNMRVRFPEVVMPAAPAEQSKMTPEDLVLALKNLPSDSQLGIPLVEAYRNITQDKGQLSVPELYKLLLQRVKLKDWELPSIVDRMRWFYQQAAQNAQPAAGQPSAAGQPPAAGQPAAVVSVDVAVSKFLHEAGMTRGAVRQLMCDQHNLANDSRLWRVLKPEYDKPGEFAPAPAPEDADDPVEQVFTANENSYKFVPDIDLGKFFWSIKDTLAEESTVYLLTRVSSDRAQKFFLYLMQTEQGGGWNAQGKPLEVTGWLNREKFLDTQTLPLRGKGLASVSAQLEEGENFILLKLKFVNRWRLALTIGDSYGAPLPGVEVLQWEDSKATPENPDKPKRPKKDDSVNKGKDRPANGGKKQ